MAFTLPDRTVVITSRDHPERLASFRGTWASSGWRDVCGTPRVIAGADAAQKAPAHVAGSAGVYGRWAAHVQAWRDAVAAQVSCLAVFEDTVVLPGGSGAWLSAVVEQAPDMAEAFWLDASTLGQGNRLLNGTLGAARLVTFPAGLHAYLIRRPLLERVLPWVERSPGALDRALAQAPVSPVVWAAVPAMASLAPPTPKTVADWHLMQQWGDHTGANAARWLRRALDRT